MRRTFFRAATLLVVTTILGGIADAGRPDPGAGTATGFDCVERLPVIPVANVIQTEWSPDGRTLAVVWFGRLPSPRSVSGYREQEITDLLDVRTGDLRPLGVGDRPQWSGTGSLISYWGPDSEELRIVRTGRVVARLAATIPEVRWVGDALLFMEKDEIQRWEDGAVRTVARLHEDLVPRYPKDDVYFSADGERFTLTRYSLEGTVERYLGTTRTGDLVALDAEGASYVEWAPLGSTLLIRYPDRLELRDVSAMTTQTASLAGFDGSVHAWTPDGRALLVGRVSPTVPAGDAFDTFRVWGAAEPQPVATLPNVLGARRFSPDGKLFAGVGRTGAQDTHLEVYRCTLGGRADPARSAPDAQARLERINAASGRFVRPAAGEISQFLRGSHTGVDIAAPFGSLVVASDDGVVTGVGWVPVGGQRVCVQHAAGLESCYYHTSAPLVRPGDRVSRGQPVALIGMTGVTTGPHVHWEAKLSGRIVDPLSR